MRALVVGRLLKSRKSDSGSKNDWKSFASLPQRHKVHSDLLVGDLFTKISGNLACCALLLLQLRLWPEARLSPGLNHIIFIDCYST